MDQGTSTRVIERDGFRVDVFALAAASVLVSFVVGALTQSAPLIVAMLVVLFLAVRRYNVRHVDIDGDAVRVYLNGLAPNHRSLLRGDVVMVVWRSPTVHPWRERGYVRLTRAREMRLPFSTAEACRKLAECLHVTYRVEASDPTSGW